MLGHTLHVVAPPSGVVALTLAALAGGCAQWARLVGQAVRDPMGRMASHQVAGAGRAAAAATAHTRWGLCDPECLPCGAARAGGWGCMRTRERYTV